jgi:sugar (pentulose or hexulose) kinase
VLPVDASGTPLAEPLMYNDRVEDVILSRINEIVPAMSAAHGPTSGLAKMLHFQPVAGVAKLLHQADWIAGKLSGRFDVTDENNALKSGYDPVARCWPEWMGETGLKPHLLPEVGCARHGRRVRPAGCSRRPRLADGLPRRCRHDRRLRLLPCHGSRTAG